MSIRRVHLRTICAAVVVGIALSTLPAVAVPGAQQTAPEETEVYLIKEVRHRLIMLPYYTIFDWLTFRVKGYDVELQGYVVYAPVKSDAGAAVKSIEGVKKVINNIKVLPLFPSDNRIRLAEYRAIYEYPGFEKYAIQAVGPIHIIVNAGHVTLDGVVDSASDRNIANIRANGVPGVFSVTNNLQVEAGASQKANKKE
ncbi:MAG: BON domain-containing protein [Terriglobia bacterium]